MVRDDYALSFIFYHQIQYEIYLAKGIKVVV